MSDDSAAWDAQIPLRLTLAAADLVADEDPAPVLVKLMVSLLSGGTRIVLWLSGSVRRSMATTWVLRR